MTGAERREQITAEIVAQTGITEAMIAQLVHGFYAKVRRDPMIGPVFEARITDWEPLRRPPGHVEWLRQFAGPVYLIERRDDVTRRSPIDGGRGCSRRSIPRARRAAIRPIRPRRSIRPW